MTNNQIKWSRYIYVMGQETACNAFIVDDLNAHGVYKREMMWTPHWAKRDCWSKQRGSVAAPTQPKAEGIP